MDPGFEAEEVKVFGAMYKKGVIYKGLNGRGPNDEEQLVLIISPQLPLIVVHGELYIYGGNGIVLILDLRLRQGGLIVGRGDPPRQLLREHAGRSPLPAQDKPSGERGVRYHGFRYGLRGIHRTFSVAATASSLKASTEQNHWGVARKMMGCLHRQQWG